MTIAPTDWVFTSHGEVKTFTVKNNGPDQSLPLHRGIFGGNASPSAFVTVQDNCVGRELVSGDSCTIGAQSFADPGTDAFLVVGGDNSQLDPSTGNRGASAHLTR